MKFNWIPFLVVVITFVIFTCLVLWLDYTAAKAGYEDTAIFWSKRPFTAGVWNRAIGYNVVLPEEEIKQLSKRTPKEDNDD